MKKILCLMTMLAALVSVQAQQENMQVVVSRNDLGKNVIPQSAIDSINYSNIGLKGDTADYPQTQIIYTKTKEYYIPLEAIDSVSFNKPQEENDDELYYSIIPVEDSSQWDSIMVTSNGYCSAIKTDEDGTVTIAFDEIAPVDDSQFVLAQLGYNLLPSIVYTKDRVFSFVNYRGNLVDVIITEKGNAQILKDIDLTPMYETNVHYAPRRGGVTQNHYFEAISMLYSVLNIVGGKLSQKIVEASLFALGFTPLNAEWHMALSISGVVLGAGVALMVASSPASVVVGGIIGLGVTIGSYIEEKVNENKKICYQHDAGNCSVETLGWEQIHNTAVKIGVRVEGTSSVPEEYSHDNMFGVIVKSGMSETGLNLYDPDASVYFMGTTTTDGDFYQQVSNLKEGIYTYRAFILPRGENIAMRNALTSYAYYGDIKSFTVTKKDIKLIEYSACPNEAHPHMIDLGLPSGTLWSCCNLGASSPKEDGDYYAWGEVETKDYFGEYNYLYNSSSSYWNKYKNIGSNISGTEYDAAIANNSGTRMPTSQSFGELITYCPRTRISSNGIIGYQFTGPSGNSIFLPLTGGKIGGGIEEGARYWSATGTGDNAITLRFRCLNIDLQSIETISFDRAYGCPIRPVSK